VRFAQSEGYLQVGGNHAMLLVQDVTPADQLDVESLRERLAEAERELQESDDNSERQRIALRDQKRWQAFIRIAEGS
jgi:F-type H+-transporting ATPase subunit epsilon